MSRRRTGGCQCGAVKFEAPETQSALYVCHCTQCQKQSASAFGISFTVPRQSLKLIAGAPLFWLRNTAKGHSLECAFCPECGTRLWHQSSGHPDSLNIKAGSFDEPVDLSGAQHIWVVSKVPGVVIPEGAIAFEREPVSSP